MKLSWSFVLWSNNFFEWLILINLNEFYSTWTFMIIVELMSSCINWDLIPCLLFFRDMHNFIFWINWAITRCSFNLLHLLCDGSSSLSFWCLKLYKFSQTFHQLVIKVTTEERGADFSHSWTLNNASQKRNVYSLRYLPELAFC